MLSSKELYDRLMSTHTNPSTSEPAISADDTLQYVVVNENCLGIIREGWLDQVEVLAGSVIKRGPSPLNGPAPIGSLDHVRPATLADFEAFRVSPLGHLRNAPSPAHDATKEGRPNDVERRLSKLRDIAETPRAMDSAIDAMAKAEAANPDLIEEETARTDAHSDDQGPLTTRVRKLPG